MLHLVLCRDVRTAAAMATADFGVHPEGREILRRAGAIRPLVLLLDEGLDSPAAEQAAKALMTLAASDINKVAAITPCCKSKPSGNSSHTCCGLGAFYMLRVATC